MSSASLTPGTISGHLQHWSTTDPSVTAFTFRSADPNHQRLTLTRREVFTFAARFAAVLRRKGIQHGDIVCNTLPNSPERLLTDLGIMLAGAVTMNGMVFLADGADLLGTLRKSGCVAIVTDPKQPRNALTVLRGRVVYDENNHKVTGCAEAPALRQLLVVDCGVGAGEGPKPFLEDLRKEEEELVVDVQPSDVAFVMTTSGSTGFSKLVPQTHARCLALGEAFYDIIGLKEGDVFFNDRSLGWVGGAPFTYTRKGITRVLLDVSTVAPADPLALAWQAMKEERCTASLLVPMHIDMSLARPQLWQDKKPRLRVLGTGGQPVRRKHTEVVGNLSDYLAISYGSTECGLVTKRHVYPEHKDSFQDGDSGLPAKGYELKIVDEDMEEVKEEGKAGEVLVRGTPVFSGYLGMDPCQQRDIFTNDGWFRTSDVGFWDSDGHLHVVCRKSNAIMHGAFIVYPGWLESRMEKCPGVRNVIVVPVPDPILYQELCACVVPEPGAKVTEKDVRDYCTSLFVDPGSECSAVPRYYVFFASFPTTSTGKTDRRAIQTVALDSLAMINPVVAVDG